MSILALKATIITLFVASATLVLTDVEVVLALVAPAPLLLIAVGGTHAARRMAAVRSGPRAAAAPVRIIAHHTGARPDPDESVSLG
jgi:hypothetical protein